MELAESQVVTSSLSPRTRPLRNIESTSNDPDIVGKALTRTAASEGAGSVTAPAANAALRRLVGMSPAMRELRQLVTRIALSDRAVLITGESGTGKELVAQAVHALSARRSGAFLTLNCAALPASMMEAELFGTTLPQPDGSSRPLPGIFERAHGGTVFLDELSEMPLEMQGRLLRVLESRSIMRMGDVNETPIDVRIIAANHRCPLQAMKEGRLREDVYYRIAVLPIHVPALRQRGSDVQLLMTHFLEQLNRKYGTRKVVSNALRQQFQSHDWPGNVRELANAIERAFVLAEQELGPVSLQAPSASQSSNERESIALPVGTRLACAERLLIESTLRYYRGNRQQTAAVLGCSLKTLYNKLQAYRTLATTRQSA